MSLLVLWLHVLAAITWIGGMLFIALVLVPIARRLDDQALRARLVHEIGLRFRAVGWVALGVLVVTGLLNLWTHPGLLSSPRFHWKLGLVVLTLLLSAFHDFVLGPRAGVPGADPSARVRASWVARVNVLVVLVIVALALSLFRWPGSDSHVLRSSTRLALPALRSMVFGSTTLTSAVRPIVS